MVINRVKALGAIPAHLVTFESSMCLLVMPVLRWVWLTVQWYHGGGS